MCQGAGHCRNRWHPPIINCTPVRGSIARFDCQSCQSGMKPYIFFGGGDRNLSAYFVADRRPSSWIVFPSFWLFFLHGFPIFCRSTPHHPAARIRAAMARKLSWWSPSRWNFWRSALPFFGKKHILGVGNHSPLDIFSKRTSPCYVRWCFSIDVWAEITCVQFSMPLVGCCIEETCGFELLLVRS